MSIAHENKNTGLASGVSNEEEYTQVIDTLEDASEDETVFF